MLNVVMLSVIMLSVVMLNVVASSFYPKDDGKKFFKYPVFIPPCLADKLSFRISSILNCLNTSQELLTIYRGASLEVLLLHHDLRTLGHILSAGERTIRSF